MPIDGLLTNPTVMMAPTIRGDKGVAPKNIVSVEIRQLHPDVPTCLALIAKGAAFAPRDARRRRATRFSANSGASN